MTNPAEMLLTIVDEWPGDEPVSLARGVSFRDSASAWRTHRVAVGHLSAIEQLIDALAANGSFVGHYRSGLERWTQHVFAEPSAWGERPNHEFEILHAADRDLLMALSQQINQEGLVNELTEAQRSNVGMALDDAINALAANDLPPELQRHMYEVITHVRRCLEEYGLFGAFELSTAIQRLMAVVQAATAFTEQNSESSPSASMWSRVRTALYDPFTVAVVGGLSSSVLPLMIGGAAG
ncbi:hypothetical protein [Oerskovia paurometabola]|uniref:hypothetical protein n=1 Tax=Oerskovia paurometabola TaxID=162170 RepID=UPI00343807B7